MAFSYVPFLDSSSAARKFLTWQQTSGADTVETYLASQHEPHLATYTVQSGGAVAALTANDHTLQIMAGATLRVHLRRLLLYQVANAAADASFQFSLFRLTTAGTGGTAITPRPMDTADAAAGATAITLPTAKGTEGVVLWTGRVFIDNSVIVFGGAAHPLLDLDWRRDPLTKCPIIPAGTSNGLALKQINNDASATFLVHAVFVESAVA